MKNYEIISYGELAGIYCLANPKPSYGETTLGIVRQMNGVLGKGCWDDFLKETAALPDRVAVCMVPGKIALLVDESGHPLEFA